MNLKRFGTAAIGAYQYISAMFPGSCRYYPSCSEYARWLLESERADRALVASILRIARCNQLFAGGIDYPVIRFEAPRIPFVCRYSDKRDMRVKYWIVPKDEKSGRYYLLKDFDNG
jgi:putative membrane protein insertion efficiency factor